MRRLTGEVADLSSNTSILSELQQHQAWDSLWVAIIIVAGLLHVDKLSKYNYLCITIKQ